MKTIIILAAALAGLVGGAWTQDVPPAAPAAQVAAPAPVPTDILVPDGTVVNIVIDQALGSRLSKPGDKFPIYLNTALVIDGRTVLLPGVRGEGEVVHAARSGMGGRPGELILAARFLNGPNGQIRLRGFQFGQAGTDRSGTSITINALSAGASVYAPAAGAIGLVGFMVTGGEIQVPAGTAANAKFSGAFRLPVRDPS